MSNSLASAGNGVTPREDTGAAKTYFDMSANDILVAIGPLVLAAGDCGKLVTNEGGAGAPGTRAITLPNIPATGSLWFRFYDQTGLGLEIIANGTNTIRVGAGPGNVSSAGGNIVSQVENCFITLRNCSTSEWVAENTIDPWTVN